MTIQHLTNPFEFDGRIKVFWLDDQGQKGSMFASEIGRSPSTQRFSDWFAITSATDLEDLEQLGDTQKQESSSSNYSCRGAPFDVYILDFRLCDSKDECQDETHLVNGVHSDAAGFHAGLQAAQKWPSHPQAIIPYSGYPEEIGEHWKLLRRFPPSGVYLSQDLLSKRSQNFADLLASKVAPTFRAALQQSLRIGKAAIPTGEHERLKHLCASSTSWLNAEEELVIQTAFGARTFKLGALLFDVRKLDENKNLVVPVAILESEILNVRLERDRVTIRALQLAELYWSLRTSPASYAAYKAIDLNQVPNLSHTVQWIGARSWKKGLGKDRSESTRIIRLAILFLTMFEHRFRLDATHLRGSQLSGSQTDKFSSLLNLYDKTRHGVEIRDTLGGREGLPHTLDDEALCRALVDSKVFSGSTIGDALVAITTTANKHGYLTPTELLSLVLPMNMDHMLPLLDPLPLAKNGEVDNPRAYSATLSSANGSRVSNGLLTVMNGQEVGDPERTINLEALLGGDKAHAQKALLDSERAAVLELASSLFGDNELPDWLACLAFK